MAITSMTGFGRQEVRVAGHTFTIEIRTVNHRFFETSIKLPRLLSASEQQIRKDLQAALGRGRVSVTIDLDGSGEEGGLVPDEDRIESYLQLARRLKKKYDVAGDLDINTLLGFSDVMKRPTFNLREEDAWPVVEKGIQKAILGVARMRKREGKALEADLRKRLGVIRTCIGKVEKRMPKRVAEARKDLRRRINDALDSGKISEDRLAAEVTLLADRFDTTEEVVRARSHIDQFLAAIRSKKPAGRKLNFLLQELQREVNTIGSKANDSTMARYVVSMKEEVEKLREQVQNIE